MKHIIEYFLVLCMAIPTVGAPGYLSPSGMAIAPDGKTAVVVNKTGKSVFLVSLPDGSITKKTALKQEPSSVAISPDGKLAYVTAGIADGELYLIETDSLKIKNTVSLGHTPVSPCVSPDGKTLYVCNRMNSTIVVFDAGTLSVKAAVQVAREPVSLALTPDGKLLFVANHLPAGKATDDHVSSVVSVIDTSSNKLVKNITLVNGAESLRGICISSDGKYIYATHLVARFLVPTTQIERGWINTNAISIMRASDQTLICTILLDDVDMGFANPWGIAISTDGALMAVAGSGTHELSLIDLKALTAKIEDLAQTPGQLAATQNNLSFLAGMRTRVQLKGIGPREVAIHGGTVYAVEYFTDSLAQVVVSERKAANIASIPLGPKLPLSIERRGELLFSDATMCFQKWQSCVSCHPDTRADSLNWDLLNDGIGNPKNAKSLILSHKTPPVMALGVRANAETAVRTGIKYIQFAVRPDEDAQAIDAYLTGLEPDPSPYLVKGKLTKAAQRGEKYFDEAGCIKCHPAPYYTDLQKYDVGTGTGQDKGKAFDVPTLKEVWRTSPYMHDGRAVTVYDVIKTHNPEDKRGKTSALTEEQIKDLAEYVNSL
jgi:YVTN family beta-propeller protein